MKPGNRFRTSLVAAFVLISLVACTPAPTATLPPTSAPTPSDTATFAPSFTPMSPSSTAEVLPMTPQDEPAATLAVLPAPPSTRTVEAMQLFFPTVIPGAGAEYRPPIYPVPWALSPYDHFYFVWPIAATYPADPVWDYRYGGIFFGPDIIHTGVDLPAPWGTEVMAAGPGTVVWAGYGLYSGVVNNPEDPYGLAVAIRHDFGYQDQPLFTVYAHMSEVDVVVGQWLDTGEVLGNVGETGVTTGPHLHFEVRLGENDFWETRNPELWLAPPQGYGVLVGRVMSTFGTILDSYQVTVISVETGHYSTVKTYAALNVHRDEYYQENVVLGGLPAGLYELNIPYGALNRTTTIEIEPGQITYFNFYGFSDYDMGFPVTLTPTP
jgi:murein DD-endopeptidase MepM/ murein hydrolase activator NlpD